MNKLRVKICGIKTFDIAESVVENGADAAGFVFYEKSPRAISPGNARDIISRMPPFINKTGVFVNNDMDSILDVAGYTGIDTIQLHGEPFFYNMDFVKRLKEKTNLPVILAVRSNKLDEETVGNLIATDREYHSIVNAFIIDNYDPDLFGGTGKKVNIGELSGDYINDFIGEKVILSGGLNASNISGILMAIRPFGIDISSGVEKEKGVKDSRLIREFMEKVRKLP